MKNKSEKIIDRIIGFLILSMILLLLGLLFRDSLGFRGFPFGWYHHPNYIRYELLIASFGVLLAVTICAAVISAFIGGIREPVMKDSMARSLEAKPLKPTVEPEETKVIVKDSKRKESKTPELKTLAKAANKGNSSKDNKSITKLIILGIAVLFLFFSMFIDDDEDYDTGYDDGTYDYELTDDTEIMSEAASEAVYQFMNGDFDSLSEIGDTSTIDDHVFNDEAGYEEYEDPYMYSTDEIEQMAFRYIVHDDASDEYSDAYLVGILVESSYDADTSVNAKVVGMSIYDFTSYDDYTDYLGNSSRWISSAECSVIGKTEIDGSFILNVFGE